jgi:hypothetical protein
MKLVLAALVLCACEPVLSDSESGIVVDDETRHWQTQAALLDPAAYVFLQDPGHTMDVTVPIGHAWHIVNMFQVRINDPQIVSEDGYAGYYPSGFVRPCDARLPLVLPEGTRIRSNVARNGGYIYYADPGLVTDGARYQIDPRGLYYERLARLQSLPVRDVIIEWISNGVTGKGFTATLPDDFENAILVNASAYDAPWVLLGGINLLDEVNNQHTVRFARSLMCPFQRSTFSTIHAIAGNYAGLAFDTLQHGEWGELANGAWGRWLSGDPMSYVTEAFNKKGTVSVLYVPLPEGW